MLRAEGIQSIYSMGGFGGWLTWNQTLDAILSDAYVQVIHAPPTGVRDSKSSRLQGIGDSRAP